MEFLRVSGFSLRECREYQASGIGIRGGGGEERGGKRGREGVVKENKEGFRRRGKDHENLGSHGAMPRNEKIPSFWS